MWKLFGLHYILVRDLCTLLIGNNVRAQHRRNMRRTTPRHRRRAVDSAARRAVDAVPQNPRHRRRAIDSAPYRRRRAADASASYRRQRAVPRRAVPHCPMPRRAVPRRAMPRFPVPRLAAPRLARATALEKALRAALVAHVAQAHLRACARGGTTFLHGTLAGMKAGQVNLFSSRVLCDF